MSKKSDVVINVGNNRVRKQPLKWQDIVFKREVSWLKKLSGIKHFPKLLKYDIIKKIIVTDYCGKPITKNTCPGNWQDQMEEILKQLDKHKCSHNDIKPSEILVKNGEITLIDFGWATEIGDAIPEDWPPYLGGKYRAAQHRFDNRISFKRAMDDALINTPAIMDLNGKYDGTIFIVGAGPQLNNISAVEFDKLQKRTSIGLNYTSYKFAPTYFISAYQYQVSMSLMQKKPNTMHIYLCKSSSEIMDDAFHVESAGFNKKVGLTDKFNIRAPTLYTSFNAALAALHMAYIIGAKKIVFIGVEQRNIEHFFHTDEEIRSRIISDFMYLSSAGKIKPQHNHWSKERLVEILNMSSKDAKKEEYFGPGVKESLSVYFGILKAKNIEIFSTIQDSIVYDAGAIFRPLSEFI